jgi:hypothetical protein
MAALLACTNLRELFGSQLGGEEIRKRAGRIASEFVRSEKPFIVI